LNAATVGVESVAGQIGALRRLFSFLPNPTAAAAGILSVAVVLASTPLINSLLLRRATDALLAMNALVFVTTLALQLSVTLMQACFYGWWRYTRGVWSGQLATSLRKALARHLLGLPFETAESYAPGELGSRVTSDVQRASGLVEPLYRLTAVVVQAVVATVMMLVLDWRVGLATAVATPLVAWLSERLSRTIGSLAGRVGNPPCSLTSESFV
jgi:ABC-type multidrug transport system fused ATPase/permease subunit